MIGGAVYGAFLLGFGNTTVALFAVAMACTGLLTTVGVIVSMDTFGPVSDNAQGIAEMSGDVQGESAAVLERLDAVGNTTKAITKGIAIATAVLAATALFGSFRTTVMAALDGASASAKDAIGTDFLNFNLSIASPNVLIGLIIGAAVVFLFSGLAIMAVGRAAGRVVEEVRNQFRTKPGIMDYTEQPDYDRVVDICTRDAQRELATPGPLAIMAPIAVGFAFGYAPLGAYLGGAIAAGVLMAVFLSNSGGAWDNAKKLVEEGHLGGKGSDAHEATIIGDTVGDRSRTPPPRDQPADQGDEPGRAADRGRRRDVRGQHGAARRGGRGVRRGHRRGDRDLKRRADPIAESAADPVAGGTNLEKGAVDGGADKAVEAPEEAAVGADSNGATTTEEESAKNG